MKIENSNLNAIPFEQINVGDVFMIDNDIYMKIAMVKDSVLGVLNAVDICDGCSVLCYDDTMVHPIEGKFVVERIW
jgi:hypothetical protein